MPISSSKNGAASNAKNTPTLTVLRHAAFGTKLLLVLDSHTHSQTDATAAASNIKPLMLRPHGFAIANTSCAFPALYALQAAQGLHKGFWHLNALYSFETVVLEPYSVDFHNQIGL